MRNSKWICALALLGFMSAADAQTVGPAPDSIEGHIAAGKNAAGGRDDTPDFYGLVTAICVAPLNAPPRPDAPAPRMNPFGITSLVEPVPSLRITCPSEMKLPGQYDDAAGDERALTRAVNANRLAH